MNDKEPNFRQRHWPNDDARKVMRTAHYDLERLVLNAICAADNLDRDFAKIEAMTVDLPENDGTAAARRVLADLRATIGKGSDSANGSAGDSAAPDAPKGGGSAVNTPAQPAAVAPITRRSASNASKPSRRPRRSASRPISRTTRRRRSCPITGRVAAMDCRTDKTKTAPGMSRRGFDTTNRIWNWTMTNISTEPSRGKSGDPRLATKPAAAKKSAYIRETRQRCGLSVAAICGHLRITPATFYRWINDETEPPFSACIALKTLTENREAALETAGLLEMELEWEAAGALAARGAA